jgi:soluble lytic murein transglycosylase-like protein
MAGVLVVSVVAFVAALQQAPETTPPPRPASAAAPTAAEAMRSALDKQRAAVSAQLEAIRKQAATAGTRLTPWAPTEPASIEAACEPTPDAVVSPLIDGAAKAQGIEAKVVRAVIEQESGFRACSVSAKGAEGLMQLMPQTVTELGIADPFDPKQNIEGGAKFLKQLLDLFKGDLPKALGAYNAGASAVTEAGGIPDIPETRTYVDAILKKLGR